MKKLVKGNRGITDLYSVYPYELEDDKKYYRPSLDVTEEEYLKNPKAYKTAIEFINTGYIEYLKKIGKYEEEYDMELEIPENSKVKECHRIVFLNLSEDD